MAQSHEALPLFYWFIFGMISMTVFWIAWHRKPRPQEIRQTVE
jgi:hypothetical protein